MAKLADTIALITGGTSGIGLATARLLLEDGATVIVTGRNPETNARAQATLGPDADVIAADTADLQEINALFETVSSRYGRLDALFVNAGVSQFAPLGDSSPELFDQHFNTNVRGAFFTIQAAVPLMPDGSAILITSSVVGSVGTPGASVYSASKAANRSLGRTLAAELVPRIRVNVISPGIIDTPSFSKLEMPPEAIRAFTEQMAGMIPMKRLGLADEVARAARFLLSDDSKYVTGVEIFVDGGVSGIGAAAAMITAA